MSFAIPSLEDLVQRARRAFRAHLPGTNAWLWPNNINPTAKVIGEQTHEAFSFADYIAKSKFALTAPDDDALELHGAEFGVARRAATPATGTVRIIGTAPIAAAEGAIFRRSDGAEYAATIDISIGAGVLDVPVQSTTNGKFTVAIEGTELIAISGVTGTLNSINVAPGGITGGADLEDTESYRSRILFRKRNPIHGGSPADYVIWATEVVGVTRVFVEPRYAGPGTIRVFFLMDDTYTNGIPAAGDVATLQAYLDAKAPAGAVVVVAAPSPVLVDVTTSNMLPATVAVAEAVLAELQDAFFRLGRVAGIATPHPALPFLATPFSFSRSWVWQAIANASGEERHILILPAADVVMAPGQIPVLGTVLHT